jgi:RNA polymerase sigma factor (sigma-70 family)
MATGGERSRNGDRAPDRLRPDSREVFAAAVELATSGAGSFRRTARRYSMCGDDADDAYQRSLEILLTKAPTASRAELRPWLHTVIKHEALALRRQRERTVVADEQPAGESAAPERTPEEAATHRERVRQTAEALGTLKPNQLQCLVLKALGYSYEEISERTGFSWTKVNRSLTEGRRHFFECFGEIVSGERCDRFQPLLSAVCDGHLRAEEERSVRAHLASCPGCRAALRAYRSAPARLAELLPPAIVLPLLDRGGLWSRIGELLPFGAGERAGAVAAKLHQGAELASAQKAAAVVASTAAIAGGGAAVHHDAVRDPGRERPAHVESAARKADREPAPPPVQPADTRREAVDAPAAETSQPGPEPPAPQAAEFGFEAAAAPAEPAPDAAAREATAAGPAVERESFGPAGGAAAAGGGGEFGP